MIVFINYHDIYKQLLKNIEQINNRDDPTANLQNLAKLDDYGFL
jgi:hypothetical protein